MKLLFLIFSFSVFIATFAQNPSPNQNLEEAVDGNLIPEPLLLDYVQATRAPGILGPITDLTDADGNPIR